MTLIEPDITSKSQYAVNRLLYTSLVIDREVLKVGYTSVENDADCVGVLDAVEKCRAIDTF